MAELMKVLIGYDGSRCAREALADLKRAGLPRRAEALVVTVADDAAETAPPSSESAPGMTAPPQTAAPPSAPQAQGSQALERALGLAEDACRLMRAEFPEWEARAEAAAGAPAGVLTAKAGRWGADLLVVGSRGRSSLGRMLLGSVSRDVVSHARCSVRIVRKGRALGGSAVKVVVGTDGSSGASDAVRAVAARVWPAGSEIRLVTAIRSARDDDAEARLSRVQDAHRADLERLLRAGLEVSHVVRTGDAKVAIVKEAKSWKADCIFVGSRGLGDSLTRYLLGSVSAALAREAPCTVEVVRPRVEMA